MIGVVIGLPIYLAVIEPTIQLLAFLIVQFQGFLNIIECQIVFISPDLRSKLFGRANSKVTLYHTGEALGVDFALIK